VRTKHSYIYTASHTLRTLNVGWRNSEALDRHFKLDCRKLAVFDFCCSPYELTLEDFQEVLLRSHPSTATPSFCITEGKEVDSPNPSDYLSYWVLHYYCHKMCALLFRVFIFISSSSSSASLSCYEFSVVISTVIFSRSQSFAVSSLVGMYE
jgi:hypothetical protein